MPTIPIAVPGRVGSETGRLSANGHGVRERTLRARHRAWSLPKWSQQPRPGALAPFVQWGVRMTTLKLNRLEVGVALVAFGLGSVLGLVTGCSSPGAPIARLDARSVALVRAEASPSVAALMDSSVSAILLPD